VYLELHYSVLRREKSSLYRFNFSTMERFMILRVILVQRSCKSSLYRSEIKFEPDGDQVNISVCLRVLSNDHTQSPRQTSEHLPLRSFLYSRYEPGNCQTTVA